MTTQTISSKNMLRKARASFKNTARKAIDATIRHAKNSLEAKPHTIRRALVDALKMGINPTHRF